MSTKMHDYIKGSTALLPPAGSSVGGQLNSLGLCCFSFDLFFLDLTQLFESIVGVNLIKKSISIQFEEKNELNMH